MNRKDVSKNLSGKYRQKILDNVTNTLKTASKRSIQKTAEATGDLISNKIPDKMTAVSKISPQNNSETITNEEEIPRERSISPKKRQQIIDGIKLIY